MSPVGWSLVVGSKKSRVVVYEDLARNGMLTLRWRRGKNWKREVLGRVLEKNRRGEPLQSSIDFAEREATRKSLALSDGVPDATKAEKAAPLTIAATFAVLCDVDTGPYPHDTDFRRELGRALTFASTVLGPDTTWTALDDAAWTKLMRRRLSSLLKQDRQGIRATEITVSRINTAAEWLRDQKRIPREAALLPTKWRAKLLEFWRGEEAKRQEVKPDEVSDPVPHRPRHTLANMRKILAAAPLVDPRFNLLLQFGAEYRLGQVRRAKRSQMRPETSQFTIVGRGKKLGATVNLTDGQMTAWDTAVAEGGYLHALEAAYLTNGTDYYLFPAGKMLGRKAGQWTVGKGIDPKKPVSRKWITSNFHAAEDKAGVKRIPGGAAYLLRRQNVDAMNQEGISPLGKQAAGGWNSTKVPDSIYAESTNQVGRDEAKRVRARTRGETPEANPKDA